MEAIKNIQQVRDNWESHTKWERVQAEKESCFDTLKSKLNLTNEEISYSRKKGKVITDAIKTMDQLSINKSENAMVAINTALSLGATLFGLLGGIAAYTLAKLKNSATKTPKMSAAIGYSIFALVGASVANFLSAHFRKKSTRIARYQARNNEMKDIRNFVVYTDEQIALAKEKAKNMPEVKDITDDISLKESLNPLNVYGKSLNAINSLNKDYAEYQKWHQDYIKKEKNKNIEQLNVTMTKEEQTEAEKDKNVLLRTVGKLEIGSNDYEINFGFGVKTAAILASLASIAGGFLGFWAFGRLSGRAGNKFISKTSDILSKISIPAGITSMLFLVGPLSKLAKDSSKIGRYKEVQRLFAHDRNFVPFTDEQLEDIREKRCFRHKRPTNWEIIKKDVKSISEIKNDFEKYNKYKKSELQEDLKIKQALKDIPISEKQTEDAKKLQKEIFMAFEKIDDKTESFVDDTTAFTEVCQKIITGIACTLANIFTLKIFGNKISQFTKNKKMPGFFEGLKLAKHLSLKNIGLIFLLPFAVTRAIIFLTSLTAAEVQKKACKIGMMSAMKELDNPKNFLKETPQNISAKKELSESIFKDFIKNNI